jgi:hypothetical protein
LPEHEAAGLREQIRRALASRQGKTERIAALEKALTQYLAWIGEPDRTAAQIIDDFLNPNHCPQKVGETDYVYSLRDDRAGRELRKALEDALEQTRARGGRTVRQHFEDSQREVWKRR